MEKPLFARHPLPWKYVDDACRCGNGSRIDTIEDAKGETVASSYAGGFKELWEMYLILTPEQEKELGSGWTEPKIESD